MCQPMTRARTSSVTCYVFVDEWRVASDVATVWAAVRAIERWPHWWPSVVAVAPIGVDATGSADEWRFEFRTRLPYRMRFHVGLASEEPFRRVATRVSGGVEGTGAWGVQAIPGGTLVRFDWVITPQRRWMQVLSPIARPVFSWNHRALMVEGGEALARRLGVALLAPTVSTLARATP
jgi:hypothetical protein